LAEALALSVIGNRGPLARLVDATRRAGRNVVDAAALTATTRVHMELGEEIEMAFSPGLASKDPDRYLHYGLELPQRIASKDGRRLILFFDEFQEISATRHPFGNSDRLAKLMRSVFQRSPDVSFLFAGSVEHLMCDLFAPTERALSQFGSFYQAPSRSLLGVGHHALGAGRADGSHSVGAYRSIWLYAVAPPRGEVISLHGLMKGICQRYADSTDCLVAP
jgi:hypothetical protein